MGDFNSVPWSSRIRRITNHLKLKSITSLKDTWPTKLYPLSRISLDHAFVSKDLEGSKEILNSIGGDHFPVLYKIK